MEPPLYKGQLQLAQRYCSCLRQDPFYCIQYYVYSMYSKRAHVHTCRCSVFIVCSVTSARSPLYSHFSTTLLGLTTVRACEMEPASLAFFHAYQDEQTRGWSVYLMASRWLAVRVDFIIGVFVTILTLSAIPLASSEYLTSRSTLCFLCCQSLHNMHWSISVHSRC